jgi:hypothetical protein
VEVATDDRHDQRALCPCGGFEVRDEIPCC